MAVDQEQLYFQALNKELIEIQTRFTQLRKRIFDNLFNPNHARKLDDIQVYKNIIQLYFSIKPFIVSPPAKKARTLFRESGVDL